MAPRTDGSSRRLLLGHRATRKRQSRSATYWSATTAARRPGRSSTSRTFPTRRGWQLCFGAVGRAADAGRPRRQVTRSTEARLPRASRRPPGARPPESAGMQAEWARPARAQLASDEDGLVPCVTQDWATGEVLTLAYMNPEALDRTLETGEIHFWSRSRPELWHKGETSGNVHAAALLRYDCDADALLALVEPAGPACHTGERTCFYRSARRPRWPPTRRCPRSRERWRARQRMPARQLHRAALRGGPPRDRRQGRGGGRGGRAGRPRGVRRAPAPRRRPTCSTTSVCARGRGLSYADALEELTRAWSRMSVAVGSPAARHALARGGAALARDYNVIPLRHTFIDDIETPVSAFLKLRAAARVPARVGRAGPALRALLVPRVPPARVLRLRGRAARGARGRRAPRAGRRRTRSRRWRTTFELPRRAARRAAAVRRRRGRAVRLRPRAHRRAPAGAEPRRHRHARHGADGLRRADRVRPPEPPRHDPGERVRRRLRGGRRAYEQRGRA